MFSGGWPGTCVGVTPRATRTRPMPLLMVCGSPKRSATLPIRTGDQMSPRKWMPRPAMAKAAARMLGATTLAITALHGPVFMNISASARKTQAKIPTSDLSITHIFSGALPLVNLSQFCDLANPHQDSFGNGAHDLTQYCSGP